MNDFNFGCTKKVKTPCGNLYVTVTMQENLPKMVGFKMGKAGGCIASQMEMTSRLISMLFELGASIETISKELKGINCHLSNEHILSCSCAISQALNSVPVERIRKYEREIQVTIEQQPAGVEPEKKD